MSASAHKFPDVVGAVVEQDEVGFVGCRGAVTLVLTAPDVATLFEDGGQPVDGKALDALPAAISWRLSGWGARSMVSRTVRPFSKVPAPEGLPISLDLFIKGVISQQYTE